jgi:hypothetical protein
MCTYFELAKVVEPKRIAVAIAEARQARNLLSARLHARNREARVRAPWQANALRLLHTAQSHLNEKEAALEMQRMRYEQAINRRCDSTSRTTPLVPRVSVPARCRHVHAQPKAFELSAWRR